MMMLSRRVAATFFCVFLLGAVAGALVSMNLADHRFYDFLNRTNDPVKLAQRIDGKLRDEYQLDSAQQASIAPLTQEMARNLFQLRRQFGEQVLSTLDESHRKIGAQMNPAQRAAYDKANEEKRKRTRSMLMPAANSSS